MVPAVRRAPLRLTTTEVIKELENESFYSSILNIKVGEKSQAAIVKDIQRHPAKPRIMHMDLQRIVADVKIKMNVPIHFLNADTADGVKEGRWICISAYERRRSHLSAEGSARILSRWISRTWVSTRCCNLSDIKVPEGVEILQLTQGAGVRSGNCFDPHYQGR